MAELSYCATQVRDFDNDRFLCALFAPAAVRDDLFALYAFNLELSKIRETVSEPLIGRMRLQFWRDAVSGVVDGNPPAHEVARPLSAAVCRQRLPAADLHALIDARETDLDDVPPRDMAALEDYAERTSSALISLGFRVLGVDPVEHADFVRDAGIAVALVGLARAIPYQAAAGRVTLPADLCAVAGLDPTAPHQWPAAPDFTIITKPILAAAAGYVASARRYGRHLPKIALSAGMPLSLAALYLRHLQRVGGDPVRFNERPPAVGRHVTLLWRRALNRV